MKDSIVAEALLMVYFTLDELAELTPGELQLLATVVSEDPLETAQTEQTAQAQREYAGRVLSKITEVKAIPDWETSATGGQN